MLSHLSSTTNVTSFSLQANDWFHLGIFMKQNPNVYDDMATQLKVQQRIQNPPSGSTLMPVTDTYLGVILNLYYSLETEFGKEIGKSVRNRFKAALEAIQATYPEITSFLAALATEETDSEAIFQTEGRKWLRGKLG